MDQGHPGGRRRNEVECRPERSGSRSAQRWRERPGRLRRGLRARRRRRRDDSRWNNANERTVLAPSRTVLAPSFTLAHMATEVIPGGVVHELPPDLREVL